MDSKQTMTPEQIISWNYSLIYFLKSMDREDVQGYKRFANINWNNVNTCVSKNGKGYVFLENFRLSNQICRMLLDGTGWKKKSLKQKFENEKRFEGLKKFCKDSGIEAGYMYGEKIMIPGLVYEIEEKREGNENYIKVLNKKDIRSEAAQEIVNYLNGCGNNDPVNIWFRYFKNIDEVRFIPQLNRLAKMIDELSYENLIQYRKTNSKALNNIYNRLNEAAFRVRVVLQGRGELENIVNKFKIEDNFKKSDAEFK